MVLPPHAYLPGQTPRHDPMMFAEAIASAQPGMTGAQLADSAAWRTGRVLFERGYFWEAHEVLEPVWMATSPNSVERYFVQALIQTANAALKLRMARPRAALRLCDIASAHLESCGADRQQVMGMRKTVLFDQISDLRAKANLV